MDELGGIAAVLGGNTAESFLNSSLSMRRQEQAQGFESTMFQNRYQMTVRDLMAAGLNPMLAYTNGVGPAPSSSAAGASPGSAGSAAVEAYNSTRLATAQAALLDAQRRNVQADTIVKGASASQIAVQTRKLGKEADIKSPLGTIMDALDRVIRPFISTAAEDVARMGAKALADRKKRTNFERKRPIRSLF